MLLTKPPGMKQVLPASVLAEANTEAQALYKQEQRAGGAPSTVRARRVGWFAHAKVSTKTDPAPKPSPGKGGGKKKK